MADIIEKRVTYHLPGRTLSTTSPVADVIAVLQRWRLIMDGDFSFTPTWDIVDSQASYYFDLRQVTCIDVADIRPPSTKRDPITPNDPTLR